MKLKANAAFTVIELIVSLTIFSLVVAMFYGAMQMAFNTSKSSLKNKIDVQKDSRRAQLKLVDEITGAAGVIKPAIGESAPYAAIIDAAGNVTVYYQKEARVRFEDGSTASGYKLFARTKSSAGPAGAEREILDSIKRLVFTACSEGSLQIDLRLFNQREEFDLITQVTLKNYYTGEFAD